MSKTLSTSIVLLFFITFIGTNNSYAQPSKHTNKLINESSPYLLQHAHNPVDWYPWGEEALAKAKKENKLILVSIGYAACHWCHVMEEESFEDEAVADFMNKNFVCIKVDREERPDIDDIYMTACQVSSGGNCGWPLNAISLPDGRPFWVGTYFPRDKWFQVMSNITNMRATKPEKLIGFAENITKGIKTTEMVRLNLSKAPIQKAKLDNMYVNFMKATDLQKGGRKGKLKFPMPNNWQFLLEYYNTYGTQKALNAVTITLDNMAKGGIYDQLSGGFSRYSTDPDWKVPHFEKMLYDNAQLVSLYSEAYKITENPFYKDIVYETLAFVKKELTASNGGFYSSIDADSEGEEGTYYVWTKTEIDELLTDKVKQISKYEWLRANELVNFYYSITDAGNWEDGKNVLYRTRKISDVAARFSVSEEKAGEVIKAAKIKLLAARGKRTRPKTDDKILTSWNALMIKGYVDAYEAFNEPQFLQAALRNADFLTRNAMKDDKRITRNYKNGKASINGFLDDYALFAEACIELYQATFDEKWLNQAKDIMDYATEHFYDNVSSKMFYYTSDVDPELIARRMEITDNVIPSSNSVVAKVLYKLGVYLYNKDYSRKAMTLLNNVERTVTGATQSYFYSNWCSFYNLIVNPPYEVAIVGDNYKKIRSELAQKPLPNALLLGGKDAGSLQLLKDKYVAGSTIVYVCKNKVCKSPVESADEAVEQMKQ